MSTIQERLQMKRVPIDKWSIKEQLCLAAAVIRSGDQNWSSVSRALKPFAEPNRPPDWFSQKNCAAQYGSLLENVETPKRKKRLSGQLETTVETPGESILRKLTHERKLELRKKIEEERQEYFKLKEEMNTIKQGIASESVIASMCLEIDQEKKQKEQDALAHTEWLKNREERKLELERVFRPLGKVPQPIVGQKRKASDSIESIIGIESNEETLVPETNKPALSPLLTSLLQTPSSLQNAAGVSSSILHTAITSQRVTSSTIASLLNSTASVPVSPSLQQLVSTAISQEPVAPPPVIKTLPKEPEIIEDTTLPLDSIHKVEKEIKEEIKEEIIEPILVVEKVEEKQKEEMKTVEMEPEKPDIKEEIIEKIEDREEEVIEAEEKEEEIKQEPVIEPEKAVEIKEEPEESSPAEEVPPEHDVYDFDESSNKTDNDESAKETTTEGSTESEPEIKEESSEDTKKVEPIDSVKNEVKKFLEKKKQEKELQSGSVEIVEVVVMEDDDSDKEMNKKILDMKMERDKSKEKDIIFGDQIYSHKETDEEKKDMKEEDKKNEETDKTDKSNIDLDVPEIPHKPDFTSYTEADFDMAIEVTKLDKSGKAKRDYSRTKKKEEKEIDILLEEEKVDPVTEDNEATEETGSEIDSQDSDKKSDTSNKNINSKIVKEERSNSPWTEEEEVSFIKSKRRYSTPATPVDSVPNSPASSIAYDDDRDYKTWKKSVMLVFSRLATHKYASLFLKPITDEQAPGYHSMVYRPMDLHTIRKNVENGSIRTTAEFHRDVLLMFTNAIMYNKSNDHVYNMAKTMQQEGMQEIQILFQAQAPIETPLRRETRTSESGFKRKRVHEDLIRTKKRRDE